MEAKRQLAEEADYVREADNINVFRKTLTKVDGFNVPQVCRELCTDKIIAMSFIPGVPIETLETSKQEIRDRVITQILRLALDEVFNFGIVQTDPNFANYSYDAETYTIGLLDFGAVREFPKSKTKLYKQFLNAGLNGDRQRLKEMTFRLGLYSEETSEAHHKTIDMMIVYVFGALRTNALFDFSDDWLIEKLRALGMELAFDRNFDTIPPVDLLYLQRKAAGLFLLGRRLKAKVPLRDMLVEYVDS